MKVVLSLDDFTVVHSRLDLLLKLKEHFPKFKVSLFTVPNDTPADYGPYLNRKESLTEIKKHLDWMQFIPHGWFHESKHEIERMDYFAFEKLIPKIEEAFNRDGLPFVRGFKAPHWRWSPGVVQALDDAQWWGGVRPEQGKMQRTKRFYQYTHGIDQPFWESNLPVLKLHGHTFGTNTDLGKCFDNLLKLPKDTQFFYCTDFLESL